MRKHLGVLGIVALSVAVGLGLALAAHHEEKQEMDPAMEVWMQAGTPGEHHEHLAAFAGEWQVEGKMWMEPGSDPMPISGVMKAKMILGGRYLMTKYSSEFMGQPFEGIGFDGYDNIKGKYVGTWMDTMSTMMPTFHGKCEDGGKTRTMKGTIEEPGTGKIWKGKSVAKWVDENTYKMESWRSTEGVEPFKEMEFTATRK